MEQKIQLKHPQGKKAIKMYKTKYEILKKALLEHLNQKGESTHTEIWKTTAENFKKKKINFEGSIQWHMEWVKLDLEANKVIKRISGTVLDKYELA